MTSNEPVEPEHPASDVPITLESDDTVEGYPLTARRVKALIAKEIG